MLKDLLVAVNKLPNPEEFPVSYISVTIFDSLLLQDKDYLFRRQEFVNKEGTQKYWVLWQPIAIK